MASVIKGERVLKLFISSSTMMKNEIAEKAPAAAAAWAANIVVTAASVQERMSSPNVSLLGGIQSPRQNAPQAVIKNHAASDVVRAVVLAWEMISAADPRRRNRSTSLIRHTTMASVSSGAIRQKGARSPCTKTTTAPTKGSA